MKKINTIPRDNMENCTEQMSEDTPNTNKDPIDDRIFIKNSIWSGFRQFGKLIHSVGEIYYFYPKWNILIDLIFWVKINKFPAIGMNIFNNSTKSIAVEMEEEPNKHGLKIIWDSNTNLSKSPSSSPSEN